MKLLNTTVRNILILVVVIALAIAVLWLVRGQSSLPLSTQASTPTLMPTLTNTPIATKNVPSTELINSLEKKDWLTYVDDVSDLSFQYPPTWEITEQEVGKSVLFLHNERGHFIYLSLLENPNNLSPQEFLITDRLKNRTTVNRLSIASNVEQFSINTAQGAIHRADDSNIKSVIIIIDQGITIRLSLRIRGTVGGFPLPSSDYTQTEQEMFGLISSLQINL